jgi:hypothetical protein
MYVGHHSGCFKLHQGIRRGDVPGFYLLDADFITGMDIVREHHKCNVNSMSQTVKHVAERQRGVHITFNL